MHWEVFAHMDLAPAAREYSGSLSGTRVGVQSLFCVQGWPCEGGSRALRGFVPLEDAAVVQQVKRGGGVLVGSTHSSELGLGVSRDTAARAVREGHVDAGFMVDTLGEARIAAAEAGLFGFKPSWGRVSRFGLVGLAPSMECCAVLAGRWKDIPAIFHAIACADDRDPSMVHPISSEGGVRTGSKRKDAVAGFFPQSLEPLSPEERSAFSRAMSQLEQSGVTLRQVQMQDLDLFPLAHQVIASVEASSSCGKYDGVRFGHRAAGAKNWNEMYLETRRESFGLLLKTLLFQGAYFQFENYAAFENACRIRARLVSQCRKLFEDLDMLLFPTQHHAQDAFQAQSLQELYRAFAHTLLANVTGQPALSLPGFFRCGEKDMGLQIVGAYLEDERLLSWVDQWMGNREGLA